MGGVDLLDQTPILDIKPYLPYCDIVPEAQCKLAPEPPKKLEVIFCERTKSNSAEIEQLRNLITEVLSLDPRPAYHQDEREYGTLLSGYNVRWQIKDDVVWVLSIQHADS